MIMMSILKTNFFLVINNIFKFYFLKRYPTAKQVLKYLHDYIEKFKINENIILNAHVISAKEQGKH